MHLMSIIDAIGTAFIGQSASSIIPRSFAFSSASFRFAPHALPGKDLRRPSERGRARIPSLPLLELMRVGRVFPAIWTNKREEFIAFTR